MRRMRMFKIHVKRRSRQERLLWPTLSDCGMDCVKTQMLEAIWKKRVVEMPNIAFAGQNTLRNEQGWAKELTEARRRKQSCVSLVPTRKEARWSIRFFSLFTVDNEGYVQQTNKQNWTLNSNEDKKPCVATLSIYIQTEECSGKGNNQWVAEQLDLESSFTFKIYSGYACLKVSGGKHWELSIVFWNNIDLSSQTIRYKQFLQQKWWKREPISRLKQDGGSKMVEKRTRIQTVSGRMLSFTLRGRAAAVDHCPFIGLGVDAER